MEMSVNAVFSRCIHAAKPQHCAGVLLLRYANELHVAMAWFCTTAVYEQGPEDGGVWAYDDSVEDDLLGAHTNRRRVHGRCGKAYVCIRRATWLMSHHLCWRTLILLSTQCLPVCIHCNLQ